MKKHVTIDERHVSLTVGYWQKLCINDSTTEMMITSGGANAGVDFIYSELWNSTPNYADLKTLTE